VQLLDSENKGLKEEVAKLRADNEQLKVLAYAYNRVERSH
jgi:hypothetical protein